MLLQEVFQQTSLFLMEGALGERLKREYALDISGEIAMAGLVREEAGRRALAALWREYAAIAAKAGLPFLATTPTRRANRERMAQAGEDQRLLAENVRFLKETLVETDVQWYAGGLMGCRGDAYTGEGALTADAALTFHSWQADALAEAGADFLMAGIMPSLTESLGMARAMGRTGLPYVISFTLEPSGRLPDGTALSDTIAMIDVEVEQKPLFYMANCVHPARVAEALAQGINDAAIIGRRFLGVQANASRLSFAERDEAAELLSEEPEAFAREMAALKFYGIRVFGGCCGTDGRHMAAIAAAIAE